MLRVRVLRLVRVRRAHALCGLSVPWDCLRAVGLSPWDGLRAASLVQVAIVCVWVGGGGGGT